ncbi:P-loop containing nucleoside triphosphate hydrolase protein [Trichodelitschia bisporula]|uniref:P-loop containing nucleoside triphosphate hydrolase protein n=1 Tax=Trichodelitschia bisporula TaxID=703511 RepID=A0A6G1HTK6_9PEZI|nr:P-loop containing nucleoside triphosphate hydrolase protein [Trichodelitschia bisporula]
MRSHYQVNCRSQHDHQSPLSSTMEAAVERLVQKAWDLHLPLPPSQRLLISIAGIPGSGKTTLAAQIVQHLNACYAETSPGIAQTTRLAAFVPMDGYHLSRAQLAALPDAATAFARRGAAFTFDAPAFLRLVKELRKPIAPEMTTVWAPSFDHRVKDPVADDIPIRPDVRIVVFEGAYLALDKDPWNEAAGLMDEIWFVRVDEEVAGERLVRRHLASGICKDKEEARRRVEQNDLVNGREIITKHVRFDEIIDSVEDPAWSPEAQGVGSK